MCKLPAQVKHTIGEAIISDTPQSPVSGELLDALFKYYEKPEDSFGKSGILEQLTKRVVERALQAELSHHLGHEKHGTVMNNEGNTRNGRSKKTLRGQHGNLEIDVPCDTKAVYLALGVNMEDISDCGCRQMKELNSDFL